MTTSSSIAAITKALVAAQDEFPNMPKTKQGYGYKYTDYADLLDMAKPVLKKHGLTVTQFPVGHAGEVGVTTILAHESGEFISQDFLIPNPEMAKMNAAQSAGAVITYARRYALSAVIGVASDDDVDAAPQKPAPAMSEHELNQEKDSLILRVDKAFKEGLYTEDEYEKVVVSIRKTEASRIADVKQKVIEGVKARRDSHNK